MTKIMLVEDDKSLREIYGVRLLAEGYEIISAGDGEEALAMAVKEKPDLVLSDVMMPKISGFDMLDILRSTPETKDIKVIMMTALSSEDQRSRGETLGANRYLVKSQVGIEDVVRAVHDVLADVPVAATPAAQKFGNPIPTTVNEQPTPVAPATETTVTSQNAVPAPSSAPAPEPVPTATTAPVAPEPVPISAPTTAPIEQPAPEPAITTPPAKPTPIAEPSTSTVTAPPSTEVVNTPPEPAPTVQPSVAPRPPIAPESAPVAPPATTTPEPTAPITTPNPVVPTSNPEPSTHLPEPTAPFSTAAPASLGERVINPPAPEEKPMQDISTLISQELELNDGSNTQPTPPAAQ